MKSLKKVLNAGLLTAATLSSAANANLLINGGFESPDVATGGWQYFNSSSVPGWGGSNIEIWDHLNSVPAYEGQQFAELNAHAGDGQPYSIYQTFATNLGQSYDVSFAYRARQSDNEVFQFDIDSLFGNISSWTISDHTTTGWSVFRSSFVANTPVSSVRFTSIVPSTGTIGNFLDDVSVTTTAQVSEPMTLSLLGLGLIGLGFSRKKLNK